VTTRNLEDHFGRNAPLHGPSREGPERQPKPPFHCEQGARFAAETPFERRLEDGMTFGWTVGSLIELGERERRIICGSEGQTLKVWTPERRSSYDRF
jgi:hypothetical protein